MEQKEYTFEEAVSRRDELLEQINDYNKAILANGELTYSETEIDEMQEEFEFLHDKIIAFEKKIARKNRHQKQDSQEMVLEAEGISFFDKVNSWCYLYACLAVLMSIGFFHSIFGDLFLSVFKGIFFRIAYNNANPDLIRDFPLFWVGFFWVFAYFLTPIIFIIATLIIYKKLSKTTKKENTTFIKVLLYVQLVMLVVVGIIVYFLQMHNEMKEYFQEFPKGSYFAYDWVLWIQEKYSSTEASKYYSYLFE